MKKIQKRTTLSIEEAQRILGAEAPIPVGGLPTDFLAMKGLASIARNRLVSRGGRPSDPAWTVSRKVPMRAETWAQLDRYAQELQEQNIRISAGQVAAIALERGVKIVIGSNESDQLTVSRAKEAIVEYAFSPDAHLRARQMKQPMSQYGCW